MHEDVLVTCDDETQKYLLLLIYIFKYMILIYSLCVELVTSSIIKVVVLAYYNNNIKKKARHTGNENEKHSFMTYVVYDIWDEN